MSPEKSNDSKLRFIMVIILIAVVISFKNSDVSMDFDVSDIIVMSEDYSLDFSEEEMGELYKNQVIEYTSKELGNTLENRLIEDNIDVDSIEVEMVCNSDDEISIDKIKISSDENKTVVKKAILEYLDCEVELEFENLE